MKTHMNVSLFIYVLEILLAGFVLGLGISPFLKLGISMRLMSYYHTFKERVRKWFRLTPTKIDLVLYIGILLLLVAIWVNEASLSIKIAETAVWLIGLSIWLVISHKEVQEDKEIVET